MNSFVSIDTAGGIIEHDTGKFSSYSLAKDPGQGHDEALLNVTRKLAGIV